MITAVLTVDDYIAAHRLHYQLRTRIFYSIWLAVFAAGIGLMVFGARTWAPVLIFGGLGAFLGQWWDDRVGLPRKVRKLYGQFKGISEPTAISWTPEAVEARGADGHGTRKWKDYVRFRENDEIFLLYITDQLWHAFPKRWFDSAQIDEFRRHAQAAGAT